jgi:TolB protein
MMTAGAWLENGEKGLRRGAAGLYGARIRWVGSVCLAFAWAMGLAGVNPGQAAEIEIVKKGGAKSLIDLTEMKASGGNGAEIFCRTLQRDLERSGWFRIAPKGQGTYVVAGVCSDSGGGLSVNCQVTAVANQRRLLSRDKQGEVRESLRLAHELADEIVFAIKGVKGIAATRIALIGATGGKKNLYLCDADGNNLVQITRDGAPCLSPSWSPDGNSLVYTSYHQGYPDVYLVDLASNRRAKMSGFPGLNSGADIGPDGRTLVLTLSREGNPELYTMGLGGRSPTRLTRTRNAAEASPCWSPDGNQVVYVSDAPGSPQLYLMGRDGGRQSRITFRGSENVAPDWGPDGRIAFSSRRGGCYQLCIYDPKTGKEEQVTQDYADHDEPSWAPDGRHIVYTRSSGHASSLYILDTLGDPEVRLTKFSGDCYSPAWSSN